MTPENLDLIAGWVSFTLTLMILSYLLGDNVLYRTAVHILIGAAAGYAAIVSVESVLLPWLDSTLLTERGDRAAAVVTALRVMGTVPLLIGALLLFKSSPRYAPVGDLGLAYIIGAGVAVAIVGAVAGTIAPLVREAGRSIEDDALDGLVIVGGTICTLVYFQYVAGERGGETRRPRGLRALALIGQFFVTLTLGILYAGAILTSLAVFTNVIREQLEFILDKVGG
ncbi:MAG: hypothetical protein JXQ72_12835 [Anaerolineae bacterium]|nr:hypothetical protein [Anaerolineae bacterium]